MGLPAGQQRVLDRIEEALKKREPRLASKFAMFSRLNIGERLPWIEALHPMPWWSPRRYRKLMPARVMLFLSLAVALVVSAVFLGMTQSPANCRTPLVPRSALTGPTHVQSCQAPNARTMGMGHGP